MDIPRKDIGICSYAYRYHVGTAQFKPATPLGLVDLIERADRLGYGRVQFYDNIGSDNFDQAICETIAAELARRDMTSALGIRHLSDDAIPHFLPLCRSMTADCFRFAVPLRNSGPETVDWAAAVIGKHIGMVEEYGIVLGLENHVSLPPEYLVEVAARVDHPLVRCIYDSTNSICYIEKPVETLRRMRGLIHTLHIKDYVFVKMEAGYMMNGVALGDGVQDILGLMKEGLSYNPKAKVELEMAMNRPEDKTPDEILAWEDEMVERSTRVLFDIVKKA